MSAHKEHYFQQAADAVFKNDHDPNIQQLYGQDPLSRTKHVWYCGHGES